MLVSPHFYCFMSNPPILSLKANQQILFAIQQEDESLQDESIPEEEKVSFLQICNNRDQRLLGRSGTEKRRKCGLRRAYFLRLARDKADQYLDALKFYEVPMKVPQQVHLKNREYSDAEDDSMSKWCLLCDVCLLI